jgi:sporulation protein YlmC with PRC-barrel domain
MSKEFAKNLFNKQVMATDGTEIGILSNIVVEIRGGNIIDMMVTPNPNFGPGRYLRHGRRHDERPCRRMHGPTRE